MEGGEGEIVIRVRVSACCVFVDGVFRPFPRGGRRGWLRLCASASGCEL